MIKDIKEDVRRGLIAVREHLSKPGRWTRNPNRLNNRTMCLMMAINTKITSPDSRNYVYNLIKWDLFPSTKESPIKHPSIMIMNWNDDPKRKKKDVLDLLDRCIMKVS